MQYFQISSTLRIINSFICPEPKSLQGIFISSSSFISQHLCEKSITSPLCRRHLWGSESLGDLLRLQALNSRVEWEFSAELLRPNACSSHLFSLKILLSFCPSLFLNKHFDFMISCQLLIYFGSKDWLELNDTVWPSQDYKLENS